MPIKFGKVDPIAYRRYRSATSLEVARSGDTLIVWKLDRLARSMKQLIDTIETLRVRGIGFRSLTEALDTTTARRAGGFKPTFGVLAGGSLSLPKTVVRTTQLSSSYQLIEQCLCIFQIGGVEPLGEPGVDGREQAEGFPAPPLARQEPGEARGRAQLERFCSLVTGDLDRLAKRGFRPAFVELLHGKPQFALEPVEFRLITVGRGLLDLGKRLAHGREPLLYPADRKACLGEKSEPMRHFKFGADRPIAVEFRRAVGEAPLPLRPF